MGTRVEYDFYGNSYDSMNQNTQGTVLIEEVMAQLDIPYTPGAADISGSSDIGNVSFQCPAFHPKLRLAGENKVCHSKEFAASMQEYTIEKTIVDGASIIGVTLIHVMDDQELLKAIKDEFTKSIS